MSDPPEDKDVPEIMMLPLTLLLLHIFAGITLNWIFAASLGHLWGGVGLILVCAAFGVILWAKREFDQAGTHIAPTEPSTAMVTTGPFQYSRNPIYLSFLVGFAGLAMLADAPLMLLMLAPLYYILDQKTIVPEETYLAEKFGGAYLEYKEQVRRWL